MTRWVPDDQELDGVARELVPPTVDPDRVEQTRTSLLARATLAAPLAARRWSMWVATASVISAAAVVVLWLAMGSRGPKQVIFALGPASYERAHGWPDFVGANESSSSNGYLDIFQNYTWQNENCTTAERGTG